MAMFSIFFRINIYAFWHSFLKFNRLQNADKSIRHDDKTVGSDMQVKIVVEYLYTSMSAAKQTEANAAYKNEQRAN